MDISGQDNKPQNVPVHGTIVGQVYQLGGCVLIRMHCYQPLRGPIYRFFNATCNTTTDLPAHAVVKHLHKAILLLDPIYNKVE